jgi:hypothetical protein
MIPNIMIPKIKLKTNATKRCTQAQQKQAKNAAEALASGFNWRDTVEGLDFWESVWQRLMQISKDGILTE